jgi:hypothetical protein
MRVGVMLLAASILLWLVVLGAPFFLGATTRAAAWSGAAFVLAEVLFWVGVAALGKPLWTAARARGWRGVPGALWERLRGRGAPPDPLSGGGP